MRTNIDIDDALLDEARSVTGIRTKKALVEEGLRRMIRLERQRRFRELRGQIDWQGDLDAMRRDIPDEMARQD